jgi:hypothetical protein
LRVYRCADRSLVASCLVPPSEKRKLTGRNFYVGETE